MKVIHYFKENASVILFCLIGGFVLPLFTCGVCQESIRTYFAAGTFSFCIWTSMWLGNEGLSHFLDEKIPWTQHPIARLTVGIAAVLLYTVTTMIILVEIYQWLVDFRFSDSYRSVIYPTVIVTFVITTIMTSRSFFLNWRQVAINAERLEKESIEARYETLKNQVNPHFLFNSLNALTNLVYDDPEKAVQFIKQLSQVYRYVLDSKDKEIVPLEEEIRFLESYVYLQNIRFGEKLKVTVDLEAVQSFVAPLCLQMLVENGIKHNILSEATPLHISISSDGRFIIVENDIRKKINSMELSPGIGLENIKKRYSFLSSEPVQVTDADNRFIVKLPLLQEQEHLQTKIHMR